MMAREFGDGGRRDDNRIAEPTVVESGCQNIFDRANVGVAYLPSQSGNYFGPSLVGGALKQVKLGLRGRLAAQRAELQNGNLIVGMLKLPFSKGLLVMDVFHVGRLLIRSHGRISCGTFVDLNCFPKW